MGFFSLTSYDDFDESDEINRQNQWKRLKKKFTSFLYSHVGLGIMVILYCVGGIFLFIRVESSTREESTVNATELARSAEHFQAQLPLRLWKYKKSLDYDLAVKTWITDLHGNYTDAVIYHGYSGKDIRETHVNKERWTAASSFLFCITVVTTIGYGALVPVTATGKLVVVIYGIVGIPLMLMYLANVGGVMAEGAKSLYSSGVCCCCNVMRKRRYREYKKEKLRREVEEEKFEQESLRRRIVADHEAGNDTTALVAAESQFGHSEKERVLQMLDAGEYDVLDDDSDYMANGSMSVPMLFSVLLILIYVCLGAFMFAAWNGWSMIEGVYFSFVTLTTIGYGDYLPGWNELDTSIGQIKLVVSAIYIIVGLAVISMALNLMMEELKNTFQYIGTKLGMVESDQYKSLFDKEKKNQMGDEVSSKESSGVKFWQKRKSKSALDEVDTAKPPAMGRNETMATQLGAVEEPE